jgi:LmbE family N-acetylglucosaminyl deacetylase
MRALEFAKSGQPLSVLCLGAHADDIEIGAGGVLLGWIASGAKVSVRWCVASATGKRGEEARASAADFLAGAAAAEVTLGAFRDGYLPYDGANVKDWVEALKSVPHPDVILTHRHDDAHQDHRLISELTWNAFRDHLILEYEVPKWDGDQGQPNLYAPVAAETLDRKIALLEKHFGTQRSKAWFDAETFRGLARLRGVECRERYAEAFWARKLVLG